MVHEGAVIAGGQRDLLVAELQLQAAVEEAEQDVVGQAQGAVAVLSVLCTAGKKQARGRKHMIFLLSRHSIAEVQQLYELQVPVPVLKVRKKSSTCWHFGSS